jgi:GNAT superfamily N-acetyltransferase
MLHMTDKASTSTEVSEATHEDLVSILAWLKHEYDENGGSGFWCNCEVIRNAFDTPETLWVIRRNGEAIAFQVGEYAAEILSVRKDHRNCGLATSLLDASIERAKAADVNALSVQCASETALGFWKRMGFLNYRDPRQPENLMVRRVLSRAFDLPPSVPSVDVAIGFYPESAQYDRQRNVPPIAAHRVAGVRDLEGSIALERRVIGLIDDEPDGRDLTIKIEVDGVKRCFCKAKHQAAKDAGVQHDSDGHTFFIDHVLEL